MRLLTAATAALLVVAPGVAAAPDVPAYGSITITDAGFGPRATWTYDGVLECRTSSSGPAGVADRFTVTCAVMESTPVTLACPLMVLTRTSVAPVGGTAACDRALDTGVGTGTVSTSGNLGRVTRSITCAAYVEVGVLVPPYTVSCVEPGAPRGTGVAR